MRDKFEPKHFQISEVKMYVTTLYSHLGDVREMLQEAKELSNAFECYVEVEHSGVVMVVSPYVSVDKLLEQWGKEKIKE